MTLTPEQEAELARLEATQAAELAGREAKLSEARAFNANLLKSNALRQALISGGCDAKKLSAAHALLLESLDLKVTDDHRVFVQSEFGDQDVNASAASWLAGQGSAFLMAPLGGAAPGPFETMLAKHFH